MKKSLILALGFAGCVFNISAAEPFIAIRQTADTGEFMREIIDVHARYPGSCDEIWFCSSAMPCKLEAASNRLERASVRWREACARCGIRYSLQQGNTLGHGHLMRQEHSSDSKADSASPFYSPDEVIGFSEEAWMVGEDGKRMTWRRFCPSSPEVEEALYRFVKMALSTHPYSYWPDDDLRLGFCTDRGCFCPRCKGRSGEELLAGYLKVYRRAADEVHPDVRFGLQTVAPGRPDTVRDYRPMMEALYDGMTPVSIRPGDLYFDEWHPRDMIRKTMGTAVEAERCRSYGPLVGRICYEEENYPRTVLQKSPAAIVTECALALASGADSLSVYFAAGGIEQNEREDYERFARCLAESRPYLEHVGASTRRTHIGGVIADINVAMAGVPVSAKESPAAVSWPRDVPAITRDIPTGVERKRLIDALDQATNGTFPVRIDLNHALRIIPRITADGKVGSVTVMNCSIGETFPFEMRVRRAVGLDARIESPRHPARPVAVRRTSEETVVSMPTVPGYQLVTVFFDYDN